MSGFMGPKRFGMTKSVHMTIFGAIAHIQKNVTSKNLLLKENFKNLAQKILITMVEL